jgi:endogenous inhibitor of DNA gyrase (YacG/DUF329 family)
MTDPKDAPAPEKPRPCPNCGKPASEEYRPFCSKRCADIDLHRWLRGAYAIPGEPVDEETEPRED